MDRSARVDLEWKLNKGHIKREVLNAPQGPHALRQS